MKTDDIKKMGQAYVQVLEEAKKLDPVGKHDADIDNDGDADKSDEYLIKRRKAISANVKEEKGEGKAHERAEKKKGDVEEALVGNQHKLDANKNGKIDSHDFKLLKKKNESTEWTVFNRIQEKLSSYKVSGVGDDPHDITTKFAIDDHTKGAAPAEEIDSTASQGEKDFNDKHGGLGKKTPPQYVDDSTIDQNPNQFGAPNVKAAPGRHNDSTVGDKAIMKSKS